MAAFHGGSIKENEPLPTPVLRWMKCRTSAPDPFPTLGDQKRHSNWSAMYDHYAGQQCQRGNGWICPHKGFDLGAIRPNANGIIQCPLHGALVNAETGVVVRELPT